MRFTCPSCSKTYRLPPERIGPTGKAQISCPNCRAVVLVRSGQGEDLDCQLLQSGTSSGIVAAAPVAAGSAVAGPAQRPVSGAFEPVAGPWFVVVGRDKVGPLTAVQIAQRLTAGELTIHSLAWHKGMANWARIEDLPDLLKALSSSSSAQARQSGGFSPVAPASAGPAAPVSRPAAASAAQQPSTSLPGAATPLRPAVQPSSMAKPSLGAQPGLGGNVGSGPAQQGGPQHLGAAPANSAASPSSAESGRGATAAASEAAAAARNTGGLQVVQAVGQPRGAQSTALPIATRPSQQAPVPAAKPLPKQEFDDAGPTLEAALPLPSGRPSPGPSAPVKLPTVPNLMGKTGPSGGKVRGLADAHGDAFFAAGHDLNDVEFSLPDPNKHKPTKEEYQNLIQEFSVMFRLDKRSKRQKVLIGVVLATLVIGAMSFGVVLTLNGQAKRQLIRDSKEILAAFDLGYRTAVVPSVPPEEQAVVVGKPGQPAVVAAKPQEISQIADKLVNILAKKKKPKVAGVAGFGAGGAGAGLSEAQAAAEAKRLADLEADKARRQREALEAANAAFGGKKEEMVAGGGAIGVKAVEDAEIRKLCREKAGQIGACAEKTGASPSALKVTITELGGVGQVVALVAGKPNDELGACIRSRMSGVTFGRQPAKKVVECKVD